MAAKDGIPEKMRMVDGKDEHLRFQPQVFHFEHCLSRSLYYCRATGDPSKWVCIKTRVLLFSNGVPEKVYPKKGYPPKADTPRFEEVGAVRKKFEGSICKSLVGRRLDGSQPLPSRFKVWR